MIWIVGNKGMLGSELSRLFKQKKVDYIGSDRDVDFLDPQALLKFTSFNKIDSIINCAAYTAVDKAEEEPELCWRLNVEGPVNLAFFAKEINAKFIHISTDYVFSGKASEPYHEDDTIDPQGTYGKTKAEGEARVREVYPRTIIVRTAWLYGEFGANFVYTMLKLMKKRNEIGVVADQFGTPTWANDLAKAIVLILNNTEILSGIYHFTDAGKISWHDFALAIYEEGTKTGILDTSCIIKRLSTDEYPTKTKRPSYSVLSKEKIARDFGVAIPYWRDSLAQFLKEIAGNPELLRARID
jgi:dTDP-4-dehydrorhamnose reductase